MIIVTITEAKRDLYRLIRLVEAGEEVIITRRGEAVVKLVAFKRTSDGKDAIA
jgi:prevent-host-death family protein